MADLIVPYFAGGAPDSVVIDGVTYYVPRVDSDGRQYASAYAIDASEVKLLLYRTVSDSSVRATIITPTAGKKVRIISGHMNSNNTTLQRYECYFGTGATILTDTAKAIMDGLMQDTETYNLIYSWPDGGGPVGDVDEVVSFRTGGNVTTQGRVVLAYREE